MLGQGRVGEGLQAPVEPRSCSATASAAWLLKVILPLAIRGEERKRKQQLLPTAIREHFAAARLDGPDTRYESMTADVMLLTGAKRRGPDDGALARVASSTPGAALVTLPGLDHVGPEKKPKVVAPAVSAFFADPV